MMEFFGFRNPFKTGNMKTVVPGEVLNGKYKVRAVEVDEDGRAQYKCVALHTHQEVLVCCAGRKEHGTDCSIPLLSFNDAGSVGAAGYDRSPYLDRFEVQSGKNTLIYVVQPDRVNAFSASSSANPQRNEHEYPNRDSDIEDPRSVQETERIAASCYTNILIYRRGNCSLEVDIPASGLDLVAFEHLLGSAAMLVVACVWTVVLLVDSISALDPKGLLYLFGMVPWWIIGVFWFRSTVRRIFAHENLIITPMHFRLKRTLEFWPHNQDSVNDPISAEASLSLVDRIFCKQISGATEDLILAAVRYVGVSFVQSTGESTRGNFNDRFHHFVLLEDLKQHRLYALLSNEERNWLRTEINATIRQINENHVSREQLGRARMNSIKQYLKFCFLVCFH